MLGNIPSRKKIRYPIGERLLAYLSYYNRVSKLPLQYSDLLRYEATIPVMGQNDKDTGWESVFYHESAQTEIYNGLKLIYALLKTGGDISVMDHLTIARIDFCTFETKKINFRKCFGSLRKRFFGKTCGKMGVLIYTTIYFGA